MAAMKMIFLIASLITVSLISIPATTRAETQADVLSAQFLPGWQTDRGTHMAALQMTLAPEWKTYWRSPGDAGIPPLFNWSGSENLAAVRFHWPRPQVFSINGMQSIGYKHELVLPIELTAKDPSRPIQLRATVDLGICRDICMPAALSFTAEIGGPGAADPAIHASLAMRPDTGAEAGLGKIGCSVEPISDGLRLTARIALPPTGGVETVVFEPGGAIWASEAVVRREGGLLTATADLVPGDSGPLALDRGAMIVTVLGQDRAVEIIGCPAP